MSRLLLSSSLSLLSLFSLLSSPFSIPLHTSQSPDIFHYNKQSLSFTTLGDWGIPSRRQKETVLSANFIAKDEEHDFAVLLGDNFYHIGVKSTQDPLFQSVLEDAYRPASYLRTIPLNVILGNHDWYTSSDAQIDYVSSNLKWRMPNHFYMDVHRVTPPDFETPVESNSLRDRGGLRETSAEESAENNPSPTTLEPAVSTSSSASGNREDDEANNNSNLGNVMEQLDVSLSAETQAESAENEIESAENWAESDENQIESAERAGELTGEFEAERELQSDETRDDSAERGGDTETNNRPDETGNHRADTRPRVQVAGDESFIVTTIYVDSIMLCASEFTDDGAREEHFRFLEEALATSALFSDYIIIFSHFVPLTASMHSTEYNIKRYAALLGPLLRRYGVDLLIGGHDHLHGVLRSPISPFPTRSYSLLGDNVLAEKCLHPTEAYPWEIGVYGREETNKYFALVERVRKEFWPDFLLIDYLNYRFEEEVIDKSHLKDSTDERETTERFVYTGERSRSTSLLYEGASTTYLINGSSGGYVSHEDLYQQPHARVDYIGNDYGYMNVLVMPREVKVTFRRSDNTLTHYFYQPRNPFRDCIKVYGFLPEKISSCPGTGTADDYIPIPREKRSEGEEERGAEESFEVNNSPKGKEDKRGQGVSSQGGTGSSPPPCNCKDTACRRQYKECFIYTDEQLTQMLPKYKRNEINTRQLDLDDYLLSNPTDDYISFYGSVHYRYLQLLEAQSRFGALFDLHLSKIMGIFITLGATFFALGVTIAAIRHKRRKNSLLQSQIEMRETSS